LVSASVFTTSVFTTSVFTTSVFTTSVFTTSVFTMTDLRAFLLGLGFEHVVHLVWSHHVCQQYTPV